MKIRFILPSVAALIVLGALLVVSISPRTLPVSVVAISICALAVSGALSYIGLFSKTKIAPGALPGLLVLSMTFADLFIENSKMRVIIALLTAALFFVLIRHLYESIRSNEFREAVQALSEWCAVMIVMGSTSGLIAAITYLTLNAGLATLIFAAVSVFVCITLARLSSAPSLLLAFGTALVLTEGFWLVSTLPLSYWVDGALLSIIAYLLFSFSRGLAKVRIKRLAIAVISLGAVLLGTARWR